MMAVFHRPRNRGSFICTVVILVLILSTILWINLEDKASELKRRKSAAYRRLCRKKRVFVYDLPSKFNRDFFLSCKGAQGESCELYGHHGLGQQLSLDERASYGGGADWWATLPSSLEVIFHHRLLNHVCRTTDKAEADFFYVPFYATLDLHKRLAEGASKPQLDSLPRQLSRWLQHQARYVRFNGSDHFTVLGSPTWAFRNSGDETWGSGLEYLPEFENMLKFEVEKFPYSPVRAVAIPYPTAFHPSGDRVQQDWQRRVRRSQRKYRWSFLAAGEAVGEEASATRRELVKQCRESAQCRFVNCTEEGQAGCSLQERMVLYLQSTFTVVPKTPHYFTQAAIFEALLGGAVPIFLHQHTAYTQYTWHLPSDPDQYSFYIPSEDLPTWSRVDRQLSKLSVQRVKRMQRGVVDLIPQISYVHPEHVFGRHMDAVDVALEGLALEGRQRPREENDSWTWLEAGERLRDSGRSQAEGATVGGKWALPGDGLEEEDGYVELGFREEAWEEPQEEMRKSGALVSGQVAELS